MATRVIIGLAAALCCADLGDAAPWIRAIAAALED